MWWDINVSDGHAASIFTQKTTGYMIARQKRKTKLK
jgi:hypothetical protein